MRAETFIEFYVGLNVFTFFQVVLFVLLILFECSLLLTKHTKNDSFSPIGQRAGSARCLRLYFIPTCCTVGKINTPKLAAGSSDDLSLVYEQYNRQALRLQTVTYS